MFLQLVIMATYTTTDVTGEFTFELNYSHDVDGWVIDSLQIHRGTELMFSKFRPAGLYGAEALLQAQGIEQCETAASNLCQTRSIK